MNTMEKIEQCICESRTGVTVTWGKNANFVNYPSSDEQVADQILSLLEPQMLTPEEARELMECFDYEPTGRYANKQYALYLKLQGIAEGQ